MSYYPAPYPPYQPVPRPLSTSTTAPKVLTFIGIAVLVLSIGIGVGGGLLIASGVRTLDDNLREIDSKVDAAAIATVEPGQTETVTLSPSASYTLLRETDDLTGTGAPPVVTDPTGLPVAVTTSTYTSSSWDTHEALTGWRFRSREAGPYEITAAADSPTLRLAPGVEIDTVVDGATGAARAVGGGLLVATGMGLGTVGVGLVIGGGVWWSVRSKNARRLA